MLAFPARCCRGKPAPRAYFSRGATPSSGRCPATPSAPHQRPLWEILRASGRKSLRDFLILFVYLIEMNEFDNLIKQLASRPTAEGPRDLEVSVWREIRHRQRSYPETMLARFASYIWRWQCAAAAVISALMIGGGLAAIRHESAVDRNVSQAVHLEVFSEHSPTLLLNSLYERL